MLRSRVQTLPVLPASALSGTAGARAGLPLGHGETLVTGDVYRFDPAARETDLRLLADRLPPLTVARGSPTGRPGADVYPDHLLTFSAADGTIATVLLMVEIGKAGNAAAVHALALDGLNPELDYTLTAADPGGAPRTLARLGCASFVAGTRVALATGAQVAVEDLSPGDRLLTRDCGPQPLRWVGRMALQAGGAFAPVRIAAGTLNAARDLTLTADHRLFFYQRQDILGIGRSELLVRARHLVDGAAITRAPQGPLDLVFLLFDRHQIVFAEGIAVESMLLDAGTLAALPPDQAPALSGLVAAHRDSALCDLEIEATLLQSPNPAARLMRALAG